MISGKSSSRERSHSSNYYFENYLDLKQQQQQQHCEMDVVQFAPFKGPFKEAQFAPFTSSEQAS